MTPAEIKALRMKLAAKRAGRYKGKSSIGGTYRSVKPFTESLHPRGAGGKFVSKPGAAKPKKKSALKPGTRKLLKQATGNKRGERGDGLPSSKQLRALERTPDKRIDLGGGIDVSASEMAGHGRNNRYYRAKELRAARAAKQVEGKPSLKEQAAAHRAKKGTRAERAKNIVSRIAERQGKIASSGDYARARAYGSATQKRYAAAHDVATSGQSASKPMSKQRQPKQPSQRAETTGVTIRSDLGRNIIEVPVTLKDTGEKTSYLKKESWNRFYYSMDEGQSWHPTKTAALAKKRQARAQS